MVLPIPQVVINVVKKLLIKRPYAVVEIVLGFAVFFVECALKIDTVKTFVKLSRHAFCKNLRTSATNYLAAI